MKRVLSILLALVLVLSMVPFAVFAEETETQEHEKPKHEHEYKKETTRKATCTEEGEVTFECKCGDSYKESVKAKGHDFSGGKCEVCGEKDPNYVPPETEAPTKAPEPTAEQTKEPDPTDEPKADETKEPTGEPTAQPEDPTTEPTAEPEQEPTAEATPDATEGNEEIDPDITPDPDAVLLEEENGEEEPEGPFTVTWTNYDGSVIRTDTDVEKGSVPEYKGGTPVFPGSVPEEYVYIFSAWNPEPTAITEDTTYKTKYVKYKSASYSIFNVHAMAYDGENSKEIKDAFYQTAKKIASEQSADSYKKSIPGYKYVMTSQDPLIIAEGKANDLYLYYMPEDKAYEGKVDIGDDITLSKGDELTAEYTAKSGEKQGTLEYTWYAVGKNGEPNKVGSGESYTVSASDAGKCIYCEVKDSGASRGAISDHGVYVRSGDSTAEFKIDSTKGKLGITYTEIEGSAKGKLSYKWTIIEDDGSETEIGTESTYTLTEDDIGKKINCEITDTTGTSGKANAQTTVYTIKASSSGNGTVTPTGTVYALEGSSPKFTFTPKSASYRVSSVKVDGKAKQTASTYTFKEIKKSHKLKVAFALPSVSGYSSSRTSSTSSSYSNFEDESTGYSDGERYGSDMEPEVEPAGGILDPDPEMADVPEEYTVAAMSKGSIARVDFEDDCSTKYYAVVYTPDGYDPTKKYNILYIVPGEDMTPEDVLGTDADPTILKLVLDHMIENGDIEPTLVCVPSIYPTDYADAEEIISVEEAVEQFTGLWSGTIIPNIEEMYSTYAETTEEESLIEAREHRAVGGIGAGAAATWYAFMYDLEYASEFIPISGDCWLLGRDAAEQGFESENDVYETVAMAMTDALFNTDYWTDDFYIHAMSGTEDSGRGGITRLIGALYKQQDSPFMFSTDRDYGNISYRVKEGAAGDPALLGMYMMNVLPNMWPEDIIEEDDIDEEFDAEYDFDSEEWEEDEENEEETEEEEDAGESLSTEDILNAMLGSLPTI